MTAQCNPALSAPPRPATRRARAAIVPRWWHSGGFTALIAMVARASNQIALLGVTLVATRSLAPADFGLFAIAAAFITLSRTMLYTGPFEYVLKAPTDEGAAVASAGLAANGVMAAGWIVLLVGCGGLAPWLFRGAGVGLLLFWLAPSNALAALSGWQEALLLRSGAVRGYYGITVAVELVAALAAVALLLAGWGLWALVAQVYVRLALFVVAYGAVLRVPALPWPSRAGTGAVLRWSASRYGAALVGFLSNYSGDLLLGAVFAPAAAGLYRAGNRVVSALSDMFVQPAGLLVTTELAHAHATANAAQATPWLRIAALFAALCWPALALLMIVAVQVAPLVLGPAWAGAGPVIAVFCCARFAALPIAVGSAVLVIADRQDRVLWIQTAAAIATALLTVACAAGGPATAALAVLAAAALTALATGWTAWRACPQDRRECIAATRLVLTPLLMAVGASALAQRWHAVHPASALWHLALILGAGGLGWLAALTLVRSDLRAAVAVLGHSTPVTC